jgi:hypothetical protein
LIFKYYDKPLTDLAVDTTTWAKGSVFNTSTQDTSEAITGILNDAIHSSDADLAYFASIVQDARWNGILALNAYTPMNLPPQLMGLAAGITAKDFYAHHVGINASVVNQSTNPITIQNSSMFGLINYKAPAPLKETGAAYAFQVDTSKCSSPTPRSRPSPARSSWRSTSCSASPWTRKEP